ncbi:hypothetical protein VHEMI09920 [[Torrubiella] hemipterigena]|uniref:Peptidase M43 pregnancy-associated plasma-A domain-containing protein n=1 Tax=[Torrubiella] hemipterigena TaxID=1531966 RepID=A0A0A1TR68_9HYPO|nr:hypothetical protein VHEMI09920 [[Torrubiella] hemipterigena]
MSMKRKLRKSDYKSLNLYYLSDYTSGSGYCYYPYSPVSPAEDNFYIDGCIMGSWTVPGGGNIAFSTEKITVHEVGLWHNLIHTFDGNNCNGPNDHVDDTPAEGYNASGCDTGRDTCPSHPGLDPIYNHMDYSDDYCRTEFTSGQIQRMQSSWKQYRASS